MSEPASKRPRVALDADAERKVLLDHPTLYYDDGNVILSSGSMLFRVHRSILSKHSPVFRDLFEQREDTKTETLRGCLHVALDDRKEEVEALLNVIYDGFRIDFPELTVVTFPTLSNIFRMATKYRIDRARVDILDRIKEEWPFDLAKHDAKYDAKIHALLLLPQQAANNAAGPNVHANAALLLEQEELAVPPAAVIALLREGGCADKEILAPLFYALSCSTWQLGGPAPGHRLAQLTHADIERFVVGLERVRGTFASIAVATPALPWNITGPHKQTCEAGALRFWGVVVTKGLITTRRPLEALKDIGLPVGHLTAYGICPTCVDGILASIQRVRSAFWRDMPAHFGFV